MMMKKLQAASGLLIAVFLCIHLVNTWLAAFGAAAYDGLQQLLRPLYQWAPLEALLLTALATHLSIGLLRIWREPKRSLSLRARAHRYAGLFLALFIVGHIVAVRGPSWFYAVYPGFSGLAYTIQAVPGYFYPYYFLLGLAGSYHGLNGLGAAARRLGWQLQVPSAAVRLATGASAVFLFAALLGFGGIWTDVGTPAASDYAQLARELFGDYAP